MLYIFYSQTNNFSRKLEIYLSCRICHKLTIFIKTLRSISVFEKNNNKMLVHYNKKINS